MNSGAAPVGSAFGEALPAPYVGVVGRYAFSEAIARGGMATVHLARLVGDEGFSRIVAIKRLLPHFAEDPDFLAMFLDEARVASRIQHVNVAPTLDVVSRQGELLLVMEFILGASLSELLRKTDESKRGIPVGIALRIIVGVLEGLQAAHDATDEAGKPLGIVHRDISPHNVLVGSDGNPRVVDFGIAKATGRMQTTRNQQLKGKLSYMAPEQLQRGTVLDGRVDVYATSIVFWELLTHARLFRGRDELDTYHLALSGEVQPPSVHRPEISERLDAIVLRGLERDRDQRYESARAMAADLEDVPGIASRGEVAQWVADNAGEHLAELKKRVAELETAPPLPVRFGDHSNPSAVRERLEQLREESEEPTAVDPWKGAVLSDGQSDEQSGAAPVAVQRGWRRHPLSWVGLVLLVAVSATAAWSLLISSQSPHAELEKDPAFEELTAPDPSSERDAASPEQQSEGAKPRRDDASTSTPTTPEDLPSADVEADPSSGSTEKAAKPDFSPGSPSSPQEQTPSPPPVQRRRAPAPSPSSAKNQPADDCSPPFTIDEDGVKIPKLHCL